MTTPEQVLNALEKQPDLLQGVVDLLIAKGLVLAKPSPVTLGFFDGFENPIPVPKATPARPQPRVDRWGRIEMCPCCREPAHDHDCR